MFHDQFDFDNNLSAYYYTYWSARRIELWSDFNQTSYTEKSVSASELGIAQHSSRGFFNIALQPILLQRVCVCVCVCVGVWNVVYDKMQ